MTNSIEITKLESDVKAYFGNYFQVNSVQDLDKYVSFQDQNGNAYYAKKSRNSININTIRRDR